MNDSFIRQMRAAADGERRPDGRDVSRRRGPPRTSGSWCVRPTAARFAFVTLLRDDTYKVKTGLTVSWPEGTPQQAFLSSGISGSGTLKYKHQVLLHMPGGNGKPRAIGQYGGVVGAVNASSAPDRIAECSRGDADTPASPTALANAAP